MAGSSTLSRPFLAGFAAVWGVTYAFGAPTATGIELGPAAAVVTIAVAVAAERRLTSATTRDAIVRLGLGLPSIRSMIAAVSVAALVVVALPVYSLLTGEEVPLRRDWPWLAVCLVAYHGVAEEAAWRGYTFGHLHRQASFRSAVRHTMPLIAATHLPVLVEAGPAVGLAAVVVAAATCVPLAHLYVLGRRTIWPAATVHAAIDAFKLVDDPAGRPGLTVAISAAALVVPFLALLWPTPAPDRHRAVPAVGLPA